MEVVGWRCDHTGEYFPHKDTYLLHLKRMATGRRFRRIEKAEQIRVADDHGQAIWNLTSVEAIFEYVANNTDSIGFRYYADRIPRPNIGFSVDSYVYDDDTDEWVVEVTMRFQTDNQSTYALMHGLRAIDINHQDLMSRSISRFEKVGRFVITNKNHHWDKLKMTEMLHGRINA